MAPLNNTRLAWSVAIASLALWVTSAPLTWGQAAGSVGSLLEQSTDEPADARTSVTIANDDNSADVPAAATSTDDSAPLNIPCPSPPAALTPPLAQPATAPGAQEGTFRLCGPNSEAAHSIEQLIAGRGFSATLSAHGDGCADLTIRVTSQASSGGRASSNLTVSLGSGQSLAIQIVSENGATRVSIGQGR